MGRELAGRPPLRAYAINLLGSLAGVAAFALVSWLELPPIVVVRRRRRPRRCRSSSTDRAAGSPAVNVALLARLAGPIVHRMEGGSLWSPYYRSRSSRTTPTRSSR